ncbi:MAG: M56 family metallopeptidase [Planctomycetota bacterium]|jgi:beta-lactamase regulating signal transducer with metallopeptidase domain
MDAQFASLAVAQIWQVTALIVLVGLLNRWLSKKRPHMAHVLWLVVLAKCLTPPLWSSPGGIFCWLQPEQHVEPVRAVDVEWRAVEWQELLVADSAAGQWAPADADPFAAVPLSDAEADELLGPEETSVRTDWPASLKTAWLVTVSVVLLFVVVRWWMFWRRLKRAPRRDCPELDRQLGELAQQLGVKRVRLLVTESRIGPAVVGLFRKTILLPAVVVDRLASRSHVSPKHGDAQRPGDLPQSGSARGSEARSDELRVSEKLAYSSLHPILAHELLHARRGDLWVGMLQTLAQAVWWFHPLVWWVGKATSREAERCCDEEVLAELNCDPAAYARSLLDVLELKSQLTPVPVFPGVRPVEVTSKRLERIMTLRQGCRRRTPLWCWLIALATAAATLPGAAFVVNAQEENLKSSSGNTPTKAAPVRTPEELPGPLPPRPAFAVRRPLPAPRQDDNLQTVVYDTADFEHLLSGTRKERQEKFEQLVRSRRPAREAQIKWFDRQPVVTTTAIGHVAVKKCLTMFVANKVTAKTVDEFLDSVTTSQEAPLACDLQMISVEESTLSRLEDAVIKHSMQPDGPGRWVIPADKWEEALRSLSEGDTHHISAPQVTTLNGVNVQIECVTQHTPGLKREDNGSLTPCMNWSGWKTHLLPFARNDDSFWVGVWFEQGTVADTKRPTEKEASQLGTREPVNVHSYGQLNFSATLKEDQIVVFPGPVPSQGTDSERWTLLTARVRRLSDKPDPNAIPSPRHISGKGAKSDAHIDSGIELVTATQPAIDRKQFSNQAQLGPIKLSVRQRGDGTKSPKLIVVAANEKGETVFSGTADAIGFRDRDSGISMKLSKPSLRVATAGEDRLEAQELRLLVHGEHNDIPQSSIRLELDDASAWLNDTVSATSHLRADRISLVLNVDAIDIEQIDGEGIKLLKTDAPVIDEQDRLVVAAYPVADLVVPIPDRVVVHSESVETEGEWQLATKQRRVVPASAVETSGKAALEFDELISLIHSTVEPSAWKPTGGRGTIVANETTLSLVVRQTQKAHAQISDLLDQLRRLQDITVQLRSDVLQMSPDLLHKLKLNTEFNSVDGATGTQFILTSDSQAEQLRKQAKLTQLPKVTLFNGQTCVLSLPGQSGNQRRLGVQPVVPGDRRSVRIAVEVADPGAELSGRLIDLLAIQDSGYVLMRLSGPEANSGDEWYVLLQPRILIAEEEEEFLGLDLQPLAR